MPPKTQYVDIKGKIVIASFGDRFIETYWMDEQIGTQKTVQYVSDLFTLDVQKISLQKPTTWFSNFIQNRRNRPLRYLLVEDHVTLNEKETARILRFNSKEIHVYAEVPYYFCFNGTLPKCDCFVFRHGEWITLDHLKNSEITEIFIFRSNLVENDMNQFLKHLMTGGCSQLKFLSLEVRNYFDIQELFVGIEDKVIEVTERRMYITPSNYEYTFNKSFDIRNEGGTRYSICLYCLNTLIIAVQPGDFQFG
ncbi:hypothetical protein CAEBREN_08662 [Caenorhabditis brenneri]|uniref:Sdz-33 F-box domain-containing protein n=1 Tax=Caenorhabditis brenneri TaxID=135651 RepID=G0MPN7_CAEBE|nr:hypothetical protein CAEBREN_08662 [Caenorhabditis brenneri]